MIRLEGLEKKYSSGASSVLALNGVDLEISTGEFVAIMGRSGSGKSTMLNILGLMDRPTAGHYWLDGEDVSQLDDDRLSDLRNTQIGFVFQSFHLLPRLTALENVLLPTRLGEHGDPGAEERAMHLLERVELADRAGHRPNEMSGGQRQRVAIARSLVNQPKVLLADEPTGNLDLATSEQIVELLHELNGQGQTIVLVTHEPDVAEHANRQIVLLDGKVQHEPLAA